MLKKIIILIAVFQFSLSSFSQEKKKAFNFSSSSMIVSYTLIGVGGILIYGSDLAMKKVLKENPIHLESQNIPARSIGPSVGNSVGRASIAGGAIFGFSEIIRQLIDLRKNNKEIYGQILSEYEDVISDSSVITSDKSFNYKSNIAFELMNEIEGINLSEDTYKQELADALLAIDDLAFNLDNDTGAEIKVQEKIMNIISDQSVLNYEYAQNLLALRLSSLLDI